MAAFCLQLAACATGGGLAPDPASGAASGSTTSGMAVAGTVTSLSGLTVNGYQIDLPRGVVFSRNGDTASAADLRIGQVVEAEASGEGRRLTAQRIAIRHEVVGPLERIDRAGGKLVVLGQRVTLASGPEGPGDSLGNIAPGAIVEVSGLRRLDGSITATRVDRAAPGSPVFVRGPVTAADANGFSIAGLRIDAPAATRPPTVQQGREAAIRGVAEGNRFRATLVQGAPPVPYEGRVRRISAEGFLGKTLGGALAVGTIPLTRPAPDARVRPGDRVIVEGTLDPRGRIVPDSAVPAGGGAATSGTWTGETDARSPLQTLPAREPMGTDRLPDSYRRYLR